MKKYIIGFIFFTMLQFQIFSVDYYEVPENPSEGADNTCSSSIFYLGDDIVRLKEFDHRFVYDDPTCSWEKSFKTFFFENSQKDDSPNLGRLNLEKKTFTIYYANGKSRGNCFNYFAKRDSEFTIDYLSLDRFIVKVEGEGVYLAASRTEDYCKKVLDDSSLYRGYAVSGDKAVIHYGKFLIVLDLVSGATEFYDFGLDKYVHFQSSRGIILLETKERDSSWLIDVELFLKTRNLSRIIHRNIPVFYGKSNVFQSIEKVYTDKYYLAYGKKHYRQVSVFTKDSKLVAVIQSYPLGYEIDPKYGSRESLIVGIIGNYLIVQVTID
ncbi:MAG: hypothetical protein JXR63_10210 [Spirochaetales bacterium]|nr:hypothetical protein [Spirochaetales bacterium]